MPMKRLSAALLLFLCACAGGPGTQHSSDRLSLPAPPPTGEPAGFVGLTGAQLKASLGQPSFSRKEYGSEMWRYDTKQCRAFFFLYQAGKDVAVNHVETAPRGKDSAADMTCLNVLRGKPASPVS
jgi:hypothetical protein